jgi:hypothetical protein
MNHQILFSERNQRIVDTGRRLIVQKIERRMFAEGAYNEATDALNDAVESGDAEQVRLAKELLTHKSDALSNAELFVDAAFLEAYQDLLTMAREEVSGAVTKSHGAASSPDEVEGSAVAASAAPSSDAHTAQHRAHPAHLRAVR